MSSLYGQFTLCSLTHNATLNAVSIEKRMLNKRFVNYVAARDREKLQSFVIMEIERQTNKQFPGRYPRILSSNRRSFGASKF
jgi:hypothetical protein